MAYFVTGATGFIGRNLVERLLAGDHSQDVYVLVRESSQGRLQGLVERWSEHYPGAPAHIIAVIGDLKAPSLGISDADLETLKAAGIGNFFHLAAIYDMAAGDDANRAANVDGTRNALQLAEAVSCSCFHHVSSIAVAGEYEGVFTEEMFDEGQNLPHPYHQTKFESERMVREQLAVPFRIYRPSIVVGDSRTGEMDKVDGPYYFFPLLKVAGDALPSWLPLLGPELGHTNLVPVDWVADTLTYLAHKPGLDGRVFHLTDSERLRNVKVIAEIARAAGSPHAVATVDLGSVGASSAQAAKAITGLPALRQARQAFLGAFGIPEEVLENMNLVPQFSRELTDRELEGSGIEPPRFQQYVGNLWSYWENYMDGGRARKYRRDLEGKTVLITGASSGIGKATAVKVAAAGGVPILVARGREKLEETKRMIETAGGIAYTYSADIADIASVDKLVADVLHDHGAIDILINNAGRSIRRSIALSYERFHDFERTIQLNYLGTVKLIMGFLPSMRERRVGHVINISSIGVQTNPPRFAAYIASKAALDAWTRVVSSECIGDNVHFTTVHMPLVRTPMIAPTKLYDRFPTISPEEAAEMILGAVHGRPKAVSTALGTAGEVSYALVPKVVDRILHRAYKIFPDSAAARGVEEAEQMTPEQARFAKVWRGTHW
jgi:short-subunit dehydrogenase/thioester reductase-like protein